MTNKKQGYFAHFVEKDRFARGNRVQFVDALKMWV
jgi:hypothetical protein